MPHQCDDLESELRALLKLDEEELLDDDGPPAVSARRPQKANKKSSQSTSSAKKIAESVGSESDDSDSPLDIAVDFAPMQARKKKVSAQKDLSRRAIAALCKQSPLTSPAPNRRDASQTQIALAPNLHNLDAERELKRMISGKTDTRALRASVTVAERRNPFFSLRRQLRKYSVNQPGVSELIHSSKSEETPTVTLTHTSQYEAVRLEAEILATTGNIQALQHVLALYPYHLEALFYTFNFLYLAGEATEAREVLEHTLFCVGEIRADFRFSWVDTHRVRTVPFAIPSNQILFLVLSAYSHALLRQNCTITAFEVLRMLWNLDPTDPMHVLFNLEYCGLRNRYFALLLEIFTALPDEFQCLPNVLYTKALCAFHADIGECKLKDHKKSGDVLLKALRSFPSVTRCLFPNEWKLIVPHASASAVEHPFIERISQVYAARNNALWKKPSISDWVMQVAGRLPCEANLRTASRDAKLAILSSKVVDYYANVTVDEILGKQSSAPVEVISADSADS